ncbi:MAG: hypothetical protein HC877_16845 [Thioploca sp.]|nr:hypothetical protein [Thioploca sp.]
MARKKRTSPTIERSQQRLSALLSIDNNLDLGNNLTSAIYREEIVKAQSLLDAYNTLLSQADGALNAFVIAEKNLKDLSERMLSGVGVKFGKDSAQYEMAGGVRKSERKRPLRKKVAEQQ